jgi:hypothetical protein
MLMLISVLLSKRYPTDVGICPGVNHLWVYASILILAFTLVLTLILILISICYLW